MYFNVNGGLSGWIHSLYVATKVEDYNKTKGVPGPSLKPSLNMMQLGEQMSTGNW